MAQAIQNVVVVGGGTAGWLTAAVIAAKHCKTQQSTIKLTLIESPDVKTIGVGEGTWPTMRSTLANIGISETDFIRQCDASFKQGSKFAGWFDGDKDNHYYHPFMLPNGYADCNLAPYWQPQSNKVSFANAVAFQSYLCEQGLAPKDITTPEYAAIANYGYHLDAGKFAQLLQQHCTTKLNVKHLVDHIIGVNATEKGDIHSVICKEHSAIGGDLFIDCSGLSALLIGQHYQVPFISKKQFLFNDTALATQIPYPAANSSIASHTLSTAQTAGWIWDIGLPTRRGVGHVYSSAHISDSQAETQLRDYIRQTLPDDITDSVNVRKITINPGHRETFWHKNCIAIGMAAGFIEPLEASALVLVELSAQMVSEQLPANNEVMSIVASRFNQQFTYHWQCIIDFLKLHYVLSQRNDSAYWKDNRRPESTPQSLQQLLTLWQYHTPWHHDFTHTNEIFSSASYQYVLYGMHFHTNNKANHEQQQQAQQLFSQNAQIANQLLKQLPENRALLDKISQYGLQKI